MAHRTAAVVQARLRQTIYDHVVALGPAHVAGTRTGEVIVSMVEGVQQLAAYFRQYPPHLPPPAPRKDAPASLARSKSYRRFAADFLDSIQGLATLKAFGQSGARL